MNVIFYTVTDDNRKVEKALNSPVTYGCNLKNDCSIIKPIIILQFSAITDLTNRNYCYISDFKRYYYIKNYTVRTQNIIEVELSVDVLMSNASQIKNLNGIISRQENEFNAYVTDDRFLTDNKTLHYFKQFSPIFENEDYVYIIAT